ncbi:hypothetical protein [Azospirillum sp. INR13]
MGALTLKRRNTGKGKERIEIALVDAQPTAVARSGSQ